MAASPSIPSLPVPLRDSDIMLSPSPLPPKPSLRTPTVRSRLSALCRQGQPHLARQLFDSIPRPTTVLWNTIIIGFVCNGFPDEALRFYSLMKRRSPSDVGFDAYTFSSVLKACADTGHLFLGRAVHCHFIRCQSSPSKIVQNSLLNMYSCCLESSRFLNRGKDDMVRRVFDTMRRKNVVSFNTLISWYVKTGRYSEAVRQFRIMLKTGIRPTPVSFVNVFPGVGCMGSLNMANLFYGLAHKMGGEFVDDNFVVSSAICMYAELGLLNTSGKIFELCKDKNTEVLNTMICAYIQSNYPEEGIELFIQALESEQTELDDVTFLLVLMATSQLQGLDLALQLHAYLIKRIFIFPIKVLNALVEMFSRCNSVDTSFTIFDKMHDRDLVSWNTMISAFVQNGLAEEGLMLAYEMQKQGFIADHVTIATLLSAASDLKNQRLGKEVHAYIIRSRIRFEGMGSYIIDMYARCGLMEAAERTLSIGCENEKDPATWNAMISGFAQNGLAEEAFGVLRQMVAKNVTPNAVTIASVLPACNLIGSVNLGKQLHGFSVRYALDQNVYVGTALVDMYSKSGVLTDAEKAFMKTSEKNSVTYTAMIRGYGLHGMAERAVSLFRSMEKFSIMPDPITFVAVLSACSYCGLIDEGLQIFRSMEREYGISPSTEHYCCVADMLGRVGRVTEAFEFVMGLGEDGNQPEIWGSLLASCRVHGEHELGEIIAEKLVRLRKDDGDPGYQVLLSNMYAAEGDWESVTKLREGMKEKGLMKEIAHSWIDVAGSINYFSSKHPSNDQRDHIYNMLERLGMELQDDDQRHHVPDPLDDDALG
ncbi:hypothetical protein MLD38_010810 [Melastoma candidum]|uniref:Uncharacterized protein n=1 Tax=Melastoma candidum TaxID=119954 RepID=A0ACB9R160_9MYRT|nr:hypothetical protein MLD38_010810 [Melastoma candidum]